MLFQVANANINRARRHRTTRPSRRPPCVDETSLVLLACFPEDVVVYKPRGRTGYGGESNNRNEVGLDRDDARIHGVPRP